ncbi:TetR/AcrR family transcriptional regulator [Bordetella bronchialis]|uniref:TetR family transcriptional regulator n=1 Tax=Bordetella bronchialis TaxID=463025 RepID=A0ABM6CN64_9BORD|nr:CerR family C-terminal domain-containing protein [Bordetella bronchialis]ANN65369.1 TetR family transcriptional regulator [Bordetella bronchialis]
MPHRIPAVLPPAAPVRADGEATRANIIEAAGQLFAERGYADTTSKAICQRARTNIAAVNYYFGSRDGLYLELLREVHRRLMSVGFLREIAASPLPAEDKLGVFLHGLVSAVVDASNWHTRLWAREILTPSPLLSQVMREEAMPKFQVLSGIVGEITGLRPGTPALTCCVLSVLAPCLVLLVLDRGVETPLRQLFDRPAAEIAAQMRVLALDGLWAVRRGGPGR